jgi:two-component system sensor histidine kinase RegB
VLTILGVHYGFDLSLPLGRLATVVLLLVILNLVSLLRWRQQRDITDPELLMQLLLDVAALTVQLYLTGGATNPFISLYLLQVTIGAVLLETWASWIVVAVASGCFVGLTLFYRPLALHSGGDGQLFVLHIQGMFICFVLAACLLVWVVTRISGNLRARDAHLAELRQRAVEEDHIVRMGLLASGAAHELGTPLSTLSVILNDWRRIPAIANDRETAFELEEMQSQLDRCKAIVSGILMSSGETRGEGTLRTSVNRFFDDLVADWTALRSTGWIDYENRFAPDEPIVSDPALRQVIVNVFDNALEASPAWVGITVERRDDEVVVTVADRGPGFDPAILSDFGKPYRSTKGRPGGGLGLFLVVNVMRKLGGRVSAANAEGGGALVTITLPLASLAAAERSPA